MPAKVMIATPTADRKVYIRYTSSVINLLKNASDIGATFSNPYFTEGALLSHARNALASLMLEADYTHILFIDSDMGFRPSAVRRLLEFDQPFVSSAYPMRKLNLERLVELAAKGLPYSQALSASSDYVGAPAVVTTPHPETGEPSFRLTDGFVRTAKVGMGLALIRREVFEQIEAVFPELSVAPNRTYQDLGVRTKVFQGFTSNMEEEGTYVSEDVAFCMRWREGCGGDIWMDTREQIDHVGPWEFSGRMIDRLES